MTIKSREYALKIIEECILRGEELKMAINERIGQAEKIAEVEFKKSGILGYFDVDDEIDEMLCSWEIKVQYVLKKISRFKTEDFTIPHDNIDAAIDALYLFKGKLGSLEYNTKKVNHAKTSRKEVHSYNGIRTDFKEGRIWIEGRKNKSKMSDSKIRKMWKILLANLGDIIPYDRLANELGLNGEMESNRLACIENLAQTKKNLIERIAKLGLERGEVSAWFIDNRGYGLRKDN